MTRPFAFKEYASLLEKYGCYSKLFSRNGTSALVSICPPAMHTLGHIPFMGKFLCRIFPSCVIEIFTTNESNDVENLCRELLDECTSKKPRRIEVAVVVQNSADNEIVNFFEETGFEKKEWATFIINSSEPVEKLLENVDKSARKIVRRTEEKGVVVKLAESDKELKEYYSLLRSERKTQGFSTVPFWLVKAQWDLLHPSNYQIFLAMKDGKLLAGMGVIFQDGYMIEVASALSVEARKEHIYANDLIKWNVIKWAHENGIKYYDLAGVDPNSKPGSKEEGIFKFKQKWGGKQFKQFFFSKKY